MPIIGVIVIGLQILCIIHVLRSGRSPYWLWVLIPLPLIGGIAYFVVEILPELMGTKQARGMTKAAVKAIDPDRDYRKLVDNLDTADTADNKRKLAEEYIERGNPEMAVKLLESALVGPLTDDPALLYGMARAQFAASDFAGSEATLLRLHAANDKFRAAEAHLLYARALEGQNKMADALAEYDRVAAYFPGAEARCRYAALLLNQGRADQARGIFADVVRGLDKAGRRFVNDQRDWYDFAKRHLG